MKRQAFFSHQAGTILIELIMVCFLIGVGVIAVYSALLYGTKVSIRSGHQTRAAQIASEEMEIIRATPYSSLTTPYNGSFIGATDPVSELPQGTANLTTIYENSPTNTIKRATITVSWLEKSQTREVQFTTLIVDQGLNQ